MCQLNSEKRGRRAESCWTRNEGDTQRRFGIGIYTALHSHSLSIHAQLYWYRMTEDLEVRTDEDLFVHTHDRASSASLVSVAASPTRHYYCPMASGRSLQKRATATQVVASLICCRSINRRAPCEFGGAGTKTMGRLAEETANRKVH